MKSRISKLFLLSASVAILASCGDSLLSSDKSNVDSVIKAVGQKTGLSLEYKAKMPGIAGGNIEGGSVSIDSKNDSYFEIFRYSTKDQAKAAEKLKGSCQADVKGYFFLLYCVDNANTKKIRESLSKM